MNKLIILTGQTCSGKSHLALNLAKQFNGEIISADSVQVYKKLNIGSAKVSKEERLLVKHHLIDILNFNQNYNVATFIEKCLKTIKQIIKKGKMPIIVGGTGLYIQALTSDYSLGQVANTEFREEMNQLAQEKGNMFVWEKLNKINPQKASSVHYNNLKRVIRYLEIETFSNSNKTTNYLKEYDVLCLGVVEDREAIYEKINLRVDNMIKQGLEKEVKSLINAGATKDMQAMTSIGYKEWFSYFEGTQTYTQTIELIKQHTRNYCKRQETFLKKINGIKLCNLKEAESAITKFIKG